MLTDLVEGHNTFVFDNVANAVADTCGQRENVPLK